MFVFVAEWWYYGFPFMIVFPLRTDWLIRLTAISITVSWRRWWLSISQNIYEEKLMSSKFADSSFTYLWGWWNYFLIYLKYWFNRYYVGYVIVTLTHIVDWIAFKVLIESVSQYFIYIQDFMGMSIILYNYSRLHNSEIFEGIRHPKSKVGIIVN